MRQAIAAARQAKQADEVPVGAVLVKDNQLIAASANSPIACSDPTAHADILVLRQAAQLINNYRLPATTLYVTLEPCMMCAGAILHARIERLVFGAYDEKNAVVAGCVDWLSHQKHTHKIKIQGGLLEPECRQLLQAFCKEKRLKTKSL